METVVSLASALSLAVLLVFLFYSQAGRKIPSRLDIRRAPSSQDGLLCVHGSDACKDTEGVDIVLVHGLGSNPDTTWLAEAPEDSITSDASDLSDNASASRAKRYVNWVTEFLVHDLYRTDQFTPRVFFFNYDSYWKRDALETRLCSMADKLLSSLELARDSETEKRRHLLFVTHSYGGLVVKQHQEIRESTKAIVFLGCPHFGSDFAKWGVAAAQVLYPLGSNPVILQGLEYGSLLLHDLHRRFIENSSDTRIINFFEQRKVRILKLGPFQWDKLCVTEQSATWPGRTLENLGLPVDHYSLNKFGSRSSAYRSIRDKINSLIQSIHPSRQDGCQTREHWDCHQVFKTSKYEQFKENNPKRSKGTCRWAIDHPLYRQWVTAVNNSLLWISADPGCGKSVLSKSLVDKDLRRVINNLTICFFFFKDNDEQNSLATALCALLHQLFEHQPHLLQHAVPAWNKNGSKLQQETDELWRILLAATSDAAARNTTCVLDALDECRDRDRGHLIAKLARFHADAASQGARQSWLKFIVTSRPYDDIQRVLEQMPPSLHAIRLRGEQENDQIHAEINRVIHVRVLQLAKELGLRESTSVRIEQTLLAMEHRTYLWLHLAIDDIRKTLQDSFRPDDEAIESVPSSVEAAYEKILARVAPEQHQKVKLILQIIVGARRPLVVVEMALALGLATSKQHRTSLDAQLDPDHLGKQLRHWCGLFVFVNHSRIYLIHQTAREFLVARQDYEQPKSFAHNTWRHCVQQAEMEQTMTTICIRCLNLEDREVTSSDDPSTDVLEAGKSRRDFIEYCCEWWTAHYSLSQEANGEDTFQDALALYNTEGEAFEFWFDRFWTKTWQYDYAKSMTPIRLAALSNHDRVLEYLLGREGVHLDARDENGRTALYWASELSHDKIVQMLLDSGADVNTKGGRYGNALQAASYEGRGKIVQMLLDRGADVYALGGYYGNALQAASASGHDEIVRMLLDRGADVNAQDVYYGNALQAASAEGQGKVVQMLLDSGADVHAEGGEYGNALLAASYGGHDKVVQTLLLHGVQADVLDNQGRTALHLAACGGHVELSQHILAQEDTHDEVIMEIGWELQNGHDVEDLQALLTNEELKITGHRQKIAGRVEAVYQRLGL
ncbi:purine and uridine phosphorylase, partial [Aureobasidium melanogenum]